MDVKTRDLIDDFQMKTVVNISRVSIWFIVILSIERNKKMSEPQRYL